MRKEQSRSVICVKASFSADAVEINFTFVLIFHYDHCQSAVCKGGQYPKYPLNLMFQISADFRCGISIKASTFLEFL